ncbi:MAG: SIR2 family NAD-dependent protein deacylase [Mangrovibacterium sp.]
MTKIVVLTGAGVSQESGLKTFRDMDGLWENYDIMDVCTPEAWQRNPILVNNFYNERRKQLQAANPNKAHKLLAKLEHQHEVHIITQNVDDLHERAGSSNVLHLHGELRKVRSAIDENYIVDLEGWELKIGDSCPRGAQLRPHIVWFGEDVPAMDEAISTVSQADILLVIGTSLNVYPAASLVNFVPNDCQIVVIDPHRPPVCQDDVIFIEEKAGIGFERFINLLREQKL